MSHFHPSVHRQRGLSLFGLLVLAVVVAFLGTVAIKTLPTIQEYMAIKHAVKRVMEEGPTSAVAIRAAFERQKQIEYGINAIGGRDLEIESNGDKFVVRFAYDKEVELFDPVYLLIKYQGTHSTGGGGAAAVR
jgi:Tfp pilus assembly major pilin PilA